MLDEVVVGVFVAEVVVKVLSEGRRPLEYFRDRWNMLDFAIAALSLIPLHSSVGTDRGRASDSTQAVVVLRIVRLLRVLKLMRILPKLRILVLGLLSSLSSIAYIGLMLLLLFYLYAVLGTTAFGENDPVFFGSLHTSMLTLFRVATLEDWSDCMYTQVRATGAVPASGPAPAGQPSTARSHAKAPDGVRPTHSDLRLRPLL